MFELIDQLESETNGVRTRAGMSENARQDYFNGSKPPFGFRVERIATASGPKNKLAIDLSEAELVREVFHQSLAGTGAKATTRNLNQRRLLARRDPGRNSGRLPSSPLILAGLLRCARCGDACQLETSGKCDASGQAYRYYNCRRFCRSGKEACVGYRIAVDILDGAILSHIAERVFTEERCHEILREFVEDQGVLRQKTSEQRHLLERERDELGKRLERWYERIETDSTLGDVGAERLRELKAKRDEVLRTLAKLKPLHTVPPYLYKPETIQRFQGRLREAFLGGDRATARVYLHNLVDHIVVGEDEITIEARANVALAMMAESQSFHPEPTAGKVLADVVDWHARRDSNP